MKSIYHLAILVLLQGCGTTYTIHAIDQPEYTTQPNLASHAVTLSDFTLESGPVIAERWESSRLSFFGFGILLTNTSGQPMQLREHEIKAFVDDQPLVVYSYAEMLQNAKYEKWGNAASAGSAATAGSGLNSQLYKAISETSVNLSEAYKTSDDLPVLFNWEDTQELRAKLLWSWGGLAQFYWRDEILPPGQQVLRVIWVHLDDLKKLNGDKRLKLNLVIKGESLSFEYSHVKKPDS